MLRVIDISDAQAGLDLSTIANQFDAVMIKATGGNGYVNPYCDGWVQQAIALGKKWGVYHYFSDGYNDGDPVAEANWFVDNILGYIGKGVICVDWERGGNPFVNDPNKARQFTQQVKARTGLNPGDYMSESLVTSMDWSGSIADGNWLWCADYVEDNTPIINFNMDPNRDPNPQWDGQVNDVMWQFTSTGRLDGYGGNLDCSFFYGTVASWDAYAGVHTAQPIGLTPAQPEQPSTPASVDPPVIPDPTPPTEPTPVQDPGTVITPTPDPTPVESDPQPVQTPVTTTPPNATTKVIVPEPTYFKVWELFVAILKKLFGRK
jgi:lysozyme